MITEEDKNSTDIESKTKDDIPGLRKCTYIILIRGHNFQLLYEDTKSTLYHNPLIPTTKRTLKMSMSHDHYSQYFLTTYTILPPPLAYS